MALLDFPFKPGFYTDATERFVGKIPHWRRGNRVRFYRGFPETIGGWQRDTTLPALTGVPRAAIDWQTLRLQDLIAVGTHSRLYVLEENAVNNITPIRAVSAPVDPFTTSSGSSLVTVTDSAHGALEGAFVVFSGAVSVGGLTLNGEFDIVSVVDANNYVIDAGSPASSSDAGGGAVTAQYSINPGYASSVILRGFGIGPYGRGTYGTPRSPGDLRLAQLWSLDTWGEDLIACFRDGGIYVWRSSLGGGVPATLIPTAPTNNKAAFVSQEDRHLVALGADGDPLLIRWCSQEDYDDWLPTQTNTAGDKRLDHGNQILCAVKLRSEHVIFTDAAAFSMQFSGPPFTFSFRPLGSAYGLVGPNAVQEFQGAAYWMGARGFFRYDGTITQLTCPVLGYVFDDFNRQEQFKVHTALNHRYGEVWWFYPSSASEEIDRYVVYNPGDDTWVFGELVRTVMVADSDIFPTPYAFSPDGVFYNHEIGTAADAQPMNSSLESGAFELTLSETDAGETLAHVSKFIPDFERLAGEVHITVSGRKYPQDTEVQASGPHSITAMTRFINPRMRCRQIFIGLESVGIDSAWRMGVVRLDVIPHGGR